ncbi:MAG: PAS domain S-box protein [Thermodesulfobacteriota bacterium]
MKIKWPFPSRMVTNILLPLLAVGIFIAAGSIYFLTPPLISLLKDRTDAELSLATDLGMEICEENFNYLLSLRLETDPQMVATVRKQAIEQIKAISKKLPKLHMVIVENNQNLVGASLDLPSGARQWPDLKKGKTGISTQNLWGEPLKLSSQYFPFWKWHIISFISEKDYLAPILIAKVIVYTGVLSIMIVLIWTVLIVFNWEVKKPLSKIIQATQTLAEGEFKKIEINQEDEMGQVGLAFNAMVDSLEKKQQKIQAILAELRKSEEQYRFLTEYSLAGITMLHEGRIVYANRRALELTGYSLAEMMNMDVLEMIHPEDREIVRKCLSSRQEGETLVAHNEFRCLTQGGGVRWLEMLAASITYRGNQVILGHAVDITEKKEAELEREELAAKLHQAQKMEAIGTLAAGVAHDLNNILAGLVGYPELLLMEIPLDSPWREDIVSIQQSGQKAADIVQDLLTLARRGVSVTEIVNLNDIIRDYLKSLEFEKLTQVYPQVQFDLNLDADLQNIKGSPLHLAKTVMNLATNAAEAMPAGGRVVISTANQYIDRPRKGLEMIQEGEYVVLTVADSGIGIAPEAIPRIFEPFYTKKEMGRSGTGLGMTVVWGTVKDHQGFIDVASREQQGTEIFLYLPITREEIPKKVNSTCLAEQMGTETILVVDDVEDQRHLAQRILTKLGYRVDTVAGGLQAIEYLKQRMVDLVILDMIMDPGLDGLETYKKMKELSLNPKTIITSGFTETERVKEAMSLGAGAYLKKPYTIETLGLAVRTELDRSFPDVAPDPDYAKMQLTG